MSGRGKLLLLALVACLVVGCRSESRHKEPGRVYDAKHKFSIIPPKDWVSRGEFMGCFMLFTGPQEEGGAINFVVNLQPETNSASEALSVSKQTLPRALNNYEVIDEGFLTIDGCDSFFLSGTFDMPAGRLQNLQYQIMTGKKSYTITFTAPRSVFAKYRPIFEKSGLSARID